MKVVIDDKVYVQNKDLQNLLSSCDGIAVPASIFDNIFGDIFIVDESNRYEFVEFSNPEDIEFFKKCDWIIDYHDFDGMSVEEIIKYGNKIIDNINRLSTKFNSLPEEQRKALYESITSEINRLDYKIDSIRDLALHKKGRLKFYIPRGNDIETDYTILDSNETHSKDNFLKKLKRKIKKDNK